MFTVGGRTALAFGDPYAGVECEVDDIASYPVYVLVVTLAQAAVEAEGPAAEVESLRVLYDHVALLARPVWNLADAKGPIPPDTSGMLRVPVPLMLALVNLWTAPFGAAPTEPD